MKRDMPTNRNRLKARKAMLGESRGSIGTSLFSVGAVLLDLTRILNGRLTG